MRLDVVAENLGESIALRLNLVPGPLAHTHLALLLARVVLEASRAEVFDALADQPLTAAEVAARCRLDPAAALKLLSALATSGYLGYDQRTAAFSLSIVARKWLLRSSATSLHDKMIFTFDEDELIQRMGDYLRTGQNVAGSGHMGATMREGFWKRYQRAMRSMASLSADEVARRTYVPPNASAMLDIGGSHGYFSVALCRRHPALSATILDLPEAVAQSAPLLAAERIGERVRHQVGSALEMDLGEARYDVIFVSNLVHHFDEATNRALMQRVARALKPGGAVTIQELIKRDSPTAGGQLGALLDLYFALTSDAGTWSIGEMASWQRDAGLTPRRAVWLRTMPGAAQQTAVRK